MLNKSKNYDLTAYYVVMAACSRFNQTSCNSYSWLVSKLNIFSISDVGCWMAGGGHSRGPHMSHVLCQVDM